MALIVCPECGKEISDKVKACPHCGYPFQEEADTVAPQPVEVTSVKLTSPEQKKKIRNGVIIAAVAIILAIVGIWAAVTLSRSNSRSQYIENLWLARSTMLKGAADAESLCNLTKAVWYNTIYEEISSATDEYTMTNGRFNDDFNDSLAALYSASSTLDAIREIEANQSEVTDIMQTLQNPPEDLIACYTTIDAMYEEYQGFTNLAISPSGSLTSYTEEFRAYDNDFMKYYEKIETQIPEE